ncbi:hypothetical protein MBT84_32890 [Streptomyces sp. MBT84]|uniref:hypothetical protein n=1 Tax=Streptomyces sp. MBT84 TaxID=1488414 RepID=UPI001C6EF2CB|nr:hypothetical protein [Streptomyces sp. MBT84]MBW8704407.1 hypothetical protein [Streptomyces sp. MBT84]
MSTNEINPGAELRYGMTMLTATHQYLVGEMSDVEYGRIIDEATADLNPQEPADTVRPCLYMAVRLARLFATATGCDVEDVLGFLGEETAQVPE